MVSGSTALALASSPPAGVPQLWWMQDAAHLSTGGSLGDSLSAFVAAPAAAHAMSRRRLTLAASAPLLHVGAAMAAHAFAAPLQLTRTASHNDALAVLLHRTHGANGFAR